MARNGTKKRLYLSRPEPDLLTTRRQITRIIPPTPSPPPCPRPPPIIEPSPVIREPAPCPPPPPPCPPPLPEPEPQIEVIAVDVEPSVKSSRSRSRTRSRSHSHTREKEVYIERDRFIPVPVPVPTTPEPRYETFRYVEAPRRYIEPPPQPPQPQRTVDDRDGTTHVHVRMDDRERVGGYYRDDDRERDRYHEHYRR